MSVRLGYCEPYARMTSGGYIGPYSNIGSPLWDTAYPTIKKFGAGIHVNDFGRYLGSKRSGEIVFKQEEEKVATVNVQDLRQVFPELLSFDDLETDEEFAQKVRDAAILARQEDALVELRDRLSLDISDIEVSLYDNSPARRLKEEGK